MTDKLIIKTDKIKNGDSSYFWVNIKLEGHRISKLRIKKIYRKITKNTEKLDIILGMIIEES